MTNHQRHFRIFSRLNLGQTRHVTISTSSRFLPTQFHTPASYYRGGTSRALIFNRKYLPVPSSEFGVVGSKTWEAEKERLWGDIFRKCIGSPDSNGRQLDGMGGGLSSLSKVLVVSTVPAQHKLYELRNYLRKMTMDNRSHTPYINHKLYQSEMDWNFIRWVKRFPLFGKEAVLNLSREDFWAWCRTFQDEKTRNENDEGYSGVLGKKAQRSATDQRFGKSLSLKYIYGVERDMEEEAKAEEDWKTKKQKEDDTDRVDVEYTFASIGIRNGVVDFTANCGNMSSAVGPYALDERLIDYKRVRNRAIEGGAIRDIKEKLPGGEKMVKVRIRNTNTNKILTATFPVLEVMRASMTKSPAKFKAEAATQGDFEIDGVEGKGAKIELGFLKPGGSKTGKLLPTGNTVDILNGVNATCIDCGNPSVFVAASDLPIPNCGTLLPEELETHPALMTQLEEIRCLAAVAMGLAPTIDTVPESIPKIALVSKPTKHLLMSGKELQEEDVDVVARAISVGQWHKAVPVTTAMSLAAAAGLKGSVVQSVVGDMREGKVDGEILIGHSSGKILVGAKFDEEGEVESVQVFRTARKIMRGQVYWG